MYSTSDFRKGLKIELDGSPYEIVDFQHVKPGKGGAFVRTRLKNMLTGSSFDKTFKSGEKVGRPNTEDKYMQYLYNDQDGFHFMDSETYEQMAISADVVADAAKWMQENITVSVLFYNGSPVGVNVPMFVELAVTETAPGIKGDTASGGSKPATLETGAVVNVPFFISEGDILKIDTRTGEYVERVKNR